MPMRSPTGSDRRMRPALTLSDANGQRPSGPGAAGEAGDGDQRPGGGDGQLDDRQPGDLGEVEGGDDGEHRRRTEAGPRQPAGVVDGQQHHHERRHERQHRHERRLRVTERSEPPRVEAELAARLPDGDVGDDDEGPGEPGDESPTVGQLAGDWPHRRAPHVARRAARRGTAAGGGGGGGAAGAAGLVTGSTRSSVGRAGNVSLRSPATQADAGRSSWRLVARKRRQCGPIDHVTPSTELLSIFFPMWNEEDYVERAIAAATAICTQMIDDGVIGDYELIIVDDKSTDRTPQLADALADKDPHVRVVHHPVNRKLGGSIKTGLATAKGDLVLYSDADLPFDFEEVPRAIRLLRLYDADLVSAYRFDRTGEGYTRAIYTFFYNLMIRTMFGVKARDINFAFRFVNNLANPNWVFSPASFSVPPNPVTGEHGYNTETQLGDFDLTHTAEESNDQIQCRLLAREIQRPGIHKLPRSAETSLIFSRSLSRGLTTSASGRTARLGRSIFHSCKAFVVFATIVLSTSGPTPGINLNPTAASLTSFNRNEPARGRR